MEKVKFSVPGRGEIKAKRTEDENIPSVPARRADGAGILNGVSNVISALGTGISSSISAANNSSYTETKNVNDNRSFTFTNMGTVAVIVAVVAVVIAGVIIYKKKNN